MYIVTERYDGVDSITPFWCKTKAETLLNKIISKGGNAKLEKLRSEI